MRGQINECAFDAPAGMVPPAGVGLKRGTDDSGLKLDCAVAEVEQLEEYRSAVISASIIGEADVRNESHSWEFKGNDKGYHA